jgi:ABC-type multidrug transport system ATPase subunit/pSer/pThr/pTyr-binding forkhead associated (FHA) protein
MQSNGIWLRATFFENGTQIAACELQLIAGTAKTIGNTRSHADIRLASDTVSRNHLMVMADESGSILVCDQGSSNGTFCENRELPPETWHRVPDGVPVFIGADVRMVLEPVERRTTAIKTTSKMLAELLRSHNEVLIGRGLDCDMALDDSMASRRHALVSKGRDGKILIKDLGSANGTYVNGRRIDGQTPLSPNATIYIGRHVLGMEMAPRDLSKETAVRAHGIALKYRNGKQALHPADIEIQTGSMTAIMGPSGCGKSTLLKVLTGDLPATQGRVEIFGVDLVTGHEYVRNIIGYVPQDDIVHYELSVREALYFAARLRLEHLDGAAINQKVDEVLQDLRISDIASNLISNISGGQRKRVCIAVELLSSPLVLFLDEPTSPLDPQSVEEFLMILCDLTHKGTTVVMVTHKPEDLAFLERAIFMAQGGHVVYSGPSEDHLAWFEARRTTEVYARLAGREVEKWRSRYLQKIVPSNHGRATGIKLHSVSANSWRQWYWLTRRYGTAKINDRHNTLMMLAQAPFIAALICLIFSRITSAVPFLIVISVIWFGTNNSARAIVGEQAIFKRERMFNLQILPYLFSKICVLGVLGIIQSALFVLIISVGYALRGHDPSWTDPIGSIVWLSLVCLSATMMGLFLSSALNHVDKVLTLVPLVLIPQIMLAGSITRINNWLVELFSYLTIARWGNEGLCILQRNIHVDLPLGPGKHAETAAMTDALTSASAVDVLRCNLGNRYQDVFGSAAGTLTLDVLWVIVLSAMFGGLTYYRLRFKQSGK